MTAFLEFIEWMPPGRRVLINRDQIVSVATDEDGNVNIMLTAGPCWVEGTYDEIVARLNPPARSIPE